MFSFLIQLSQPSAAALLAVQVSLRVRPATTVASAWHAGWRPTAARRIGSAPTRRPFHCWAPPRRWQALVSGWGWGDVRRKTRGMFTTVFKKLKHCLVGECWVWGLIILLYSSFLSGIITFQLGNPMKKRRIQGGKLWTVEASRWLKQFFVSQLGVKRFDGTSFVTYSFFELRYIYIYPSIYLSIYLYILCIISLDEFTKHLGVFTPCLIATGFSPLHSRNDGTAKLVDLMDGKSWSREGREGV